MKGDRYSSGFTLIEVLVVIAISAILASVVLARVVVAKAYARDANRVESVRQLKNALELYEKSANSYPVCAIEAVINGENDCLSLALIAANATGRTPTDPLGEANGSCGSPGSFVYCYESQDGKSYIISYHLETDSIKQNGWYNEIP